MPRKVTAGDGWHPYAIGVYNDTSTAAKDFQVDLGRGAFAIYMTGDIADDYSSYVHVQIKDRTSGEWRDVAFANDSYDISQYAITDLAPHTSLHIQARFRVAADFPVHPQTDGSIGSADLDVQTYQHNPAREGACIRVTDSKSAQILEAGRSTTAPTDSPTGAALPATGSSPALPLLAATGAALAAGTAALYTTRRRRPTHR
jgi:LPXTG-motif cell wall-anchored protein